MPNTKHLDLQWLSLIGRHYRKGFSTDLILLITIFALSRLIIHSFATLGLNSQIFATFFIEQVAALSVETHLMRRVLLHLGIGRQTGDKAMIIS